MLRIIKPREITKEYAYRRIFRSDFECFGFLCDEEGNPIFESMHAEKRYKECLTKPNKYKDCGRVRREYTNIAYAIGICECGCRLKLEKRFRAPGVKCRCGRVYAEDGTEIPSPSQRSSET